MLDLVQAQKDLFMVLQSSVQLAKVNVVLQRQMQLASEVNMATVFTTPRGGYAGAGMLVEMPVANCTSPNVAGPQLDWVFPVLVLEVPALNFASAQAGGEVQGTQLAAEQIVQMVLDEVHHYADENLSTFKPDTSTVSPANIDKIALGYRIAFTMLKGKSTQTTRTGQVQVTLASGSFSLACALDPSAPIWYTTDGSFPANSTTVNPTTNLYAGGSVSVASGSQLRARAYAANKLGSATTRSVIP